MDKLRDLLFENITEEEYRKSEKLSYSFLKNIDEIGGRALFDSIDKKQSTGMKIGSIVDSMLTNTKELEKYVIMKYDRPTGQVGILSDHLILNDEIDLNDIEKINEESLNLNLFGSRKTLKSRSEAFNVDSFYNYIKERRLNKNKIPCTQGEWDLCEYMTNIFYTHEFTRDIFMPKDDIEVINQGILFYKLFGYNFKSMLDKCLIDHKNKTIYPYDIKTGEERNFIKQFWNFKYYIQGGLYKTALITKLKELNIDYKVEDFMFIYLSRNSTFPLKYKMSNKFIDMAIDGFYKSGFKYNGIKEILEAYNYYKTSKTTDTKYEFVKSNGIIGIPDPE